LDKGLTIPLGKSLLRILLDILPNSNERHSIFYGNHYKYLTHGSGSNLEPPPEIMTKRQASYKQFITNSAEDKKNFFANSTKKQQQQQQQQQQDDESITRRFRKVAHSMRHVHTAATEAELRVIWVEKFEAGVRFWVNKETGDVMKTCPWDRSNLRRDTFAKIDTSAAQGPKLSTQAVAAMRMNRVSKNEHDIDVLMERNMHGTGSLVYDSSEVEELFQLLDGVKM
jgi:hypothetical protein